MRMKNPSKFPRRLEAQVFRGFLLVILLVSGVFGFLSFNLERNRLDRTLESIELLLDAGVGQKTGSIANLMFFRNREGIALTLERFSAIKGILAAEVYEPDGSLSYSPLENPLTPRLDKSARAESGAVVGRMTVSRRPALSYTAPLIALGTNYGYLRVYYDLSEPIAQMESSAMLFAGFFVALILTSLAILRALTGRYVIRPISKLSSVMRRVAEGDLGAQADIRSNNEIGIMTEAFNAMSRENAVMYHQLEEINLSLEDQVLKRTKELKESQGLLESVLNASQDGIMVLKSVKKDDEIVDFQWLMMNPEAMAVFVDRVSSIVGTNILSRVPAIAQEEIFEDFRTVARTKAPVEKEIYFDLESIRGWYRFSIVAIDEGISVTFRNISERKLLELDLEKRAKLDGLTGIANRSFFEERLAGEWEKAGAERHSLAVIMIDVDYFKRFNDTYGHLAGDQCLRRCAEAFEKNAKRPLDLAARYGGEEFVILLPRTDRDGAALVADAIQRDIRDLAIPHSASDVGETLTVSMGIAVASPREAEAMASFIESADRALYQAKKQGRDRYCLSE